jgi:phosphosulfolactate synthase
VLDKGVPAPRLEAILNAVAPYVDIWKFGWGTAYLDAELPAKLALLAAADVHTCLGGTLLEIAWGQRQHVACLTWARQAGFTCVEISRGVVPMAMADKRDLLRLAAESFVVLSEVGNKDPHRELTVEQWAEEIAGDLRAGARWVITEGRDSGTVGIYRNDGTVREDILDAAVHAAGVQRLLFEAPRKDQQAWLIRAFGAEVNLANITPDEVLALETLRLGLRADTCDLAWQRQAV